MTENRKLVIRPEGLQQVFESLQERDYRIVGPTVADGAIVYDELDTPSDLPVGWTDEQKAGSYALTRRKDDAIFGYTVGPHSWKKYLHPAHRRLWSAQKVGDEILVKEDSEPLPKFAFIGVRSCELHAMDVQDSVFISASFQDRSYQMRRENVFIVAVNCTQAGGTCFCVSMDTGPAVTSPFDLAITEILDADSHRLLIESGSAPGDSILSELAGTAAQEGDQRAAEAAIDRARKQMGRAMNTDGIKELLQSSQDHPRWDDVADRCLTCANCTMVCPTCFCTTVEDTTDLSGDHAERWQRWDSCFTMDFSYIHGGSVRASAKSRYRQWMTHKLAHWFDQFGTSGCVGCGRCITWCPVGIDITEEAAAIRADRGPGREAR